jgi:uncharacterized protein YfiM (DUF2279 family)
MFMFKRSAIFVLLLMLGISKSGFCIRDTTLPARTNCVRLFPFIPTDKKIPIIIGANIGIYGGSMAALYQTWYKNYPKGGFRSFNDWDEWMQMDKFGHVFSAYEMSRYGYMLWDYAGVSEKKKIWLGGLTGVAYQTVIEVLDGTRAQWGWSWGDVGGNVLGSAFFVSQQLAWKEQRIKIKTSFHRNRYSASDLNQRSDQVFGRSLPERLLKDYNGQTYWLSANVQSFIPEKKWPAWLNVAVGTGAEGMFGARSNRSLDENGNVKFDRTDIARHRQWYLAPDIDLTAIPTRNKWIRGLLFVLNALKFPTPALEWSKGSMKWHWIYF